MIILNLVFFGGSINVPQADSVVIAGRQEVAVQVRVPGETVAFLLVTPKTEIGYANSVGIGFRRVLRVVKDEYIAAGGLGGDDARVLRHVAGSVHLPLVIDLDFDLNFSGDTSKSPKLSLLVVVVGCVKLGILVW